jgi:CelD/BcsL family acetyltransferase involved in cellulose biosynthesis
MSAPLALDVISDLASLRALRAPWDALLDRSRARGVFLTWEWVSSWWELYGQGQELFVVSVRDARGRLVGLAPLKIAQRRYHGLAYRQLELVGHGGEVCPEHLDLVLDPDLEDHVADAIVGHLVDPQRDWDVLHLSDLREQAAVVRALRRDPGIRFQLLDRSVCPYLALPPSWEGYLSTLSPNWRWRVRRRLRRLQASHRVRLVRGDRTADPEAALEHLFRLHEARWKPRGEAGSFGRDPRTAPFHRTLARRLGERGWLRLYLLEVDGTAVAALLGYEYAGVLSYYQAGFDPVWAEHAVGAVLMGEVIRDAIERKLTGFDFLRGAEPFKFHWTSQVRRTSSLRVWGRGARARAHRALSRASRHARAVAAIARGAPTT